MRWVPDHGRCRHAVLADRRRCTNLRPNCADACRPQGRLAPHGSCATRWRLTSSTTRRLLPKRWREQPTCRGCRCQSTHQLPCQPKRAPARNQTSTPRNGACSPRLGRSELHRRRYCSCGLDLEIFAISEIERLGKNDSGERLRGVVVALNGIVVELAGERHTAFGVL